MLLIASQVPATIGSACSGLETCLRCLAHCTRKRSGHPHALGSSSPRGIGPERTGSLKQHRPRGEGEERVGEIARENSKKGSKRDVEDESERQRKQNFVASSAKTLELRHELPDTAETQSLGPRESEDQASLKSSSLVALVIKVRSARSAPRYQNWAEVLVDESSPSPPI